MKYSVIIPAYNCANTIESTVLSVICSGLTEYEILIVNDGSSDDTPVVLADLAAHNSCVKVFSKQNGGVSSSRNLGLAHAVGEYLLFIDADDIIEKNAFAPFDAVLDQFQPDMFLYGMRFDHYYKGTLYQQEELSFPSGGLRSADEWKPLLSKLFRCNYLSPVWNKFIRRDIVSRNGVRFSENMHIMEDCYFSLDCLQHCDQIYISSDIAYCYVLLDDENKAAKRVRRIPSLTAYMEPFSALPDAFSNVTREIYYMLLRQKVWSASTVSELRAVADDHRTSSYSPVFPNDIALDRALRDDRLTSLLVKNYKNRIRHRLALSYKKMKASGKH